MKKQIYLIIIVLVVGIWLGINLIQDQPLFSNPFDDESVTERAKEGAEALKRKAEDTAERVFDY